MKRSRTRAKQIQDSVSNRKKVPEDSGTLLSSGSTLLNLSCTDCAEGAFKTGKIVNIVGDSASGKTLLCLSTLAEACRNPAFDEYNLVFDDSEASMEFDIESLFGEKTAARVTILQDEDSAKTVLDFVDHIMHLCKQKKPFIYVLDSMDSITTEAAQNKIQEQIEKRGNAKGTYGVDKPKFLSNVLGDIANKVKALDSIVIIISQTRDNIGSMFAPKTRSGGNALRFYSTLEIWLAVVETIKSKGRVIGHKVKSRVKKNKITGKIRDALFGTYYDYGIDDIQSCIDFLIQEGHWKKSKNSIIAPEFKCAEEGASVRTIIKYIEDKHGEKRLCKITEKVWRGIEESIRLDRKKKYE